MRDRLGRDVMGATPARPIVRPSSTSIGVGHLLFAVHRRPAGCSRLAIETVLGGHVKKTKHRSSALLITEIALGTGTGALAIVNLISREWIEIVFGVDPDHGSGALEWLTVAALATATVVFGLLASHEWRKPQASLAL
jgi:hypothetical protein